MFVRGGVVVCGSGGGKGDVGIDVIVSLGKEDEKHCGE